MVYRLFKKPQEIDRNFMNQKLYHPLHLKVAQSGLLQLWLWVCTALRYDLVKPEFCAWDRMLWLEFEGLYLQYI